VLSALLFWCNVRTEPRTVVRKARVGADTSITLVETGAGSSALGPLHVSHSYAGPQLQASLVRPTQVPGLGSNFLFFFQNVTYFLLGWSFF
jgi:hypothetical protein